MTSTDTNTELMECRACDGTGEIEREGNLDLDSIESLRKELISTATLVSKYTGLQAESRGMRIRDAARISWLASRIVWLESSAVQRAEDIAKYPSLASSKEN